MPLSKIFFVLSTVSLGKKMYQKKGGFQDKEKKENVENIFKIV